MVEEDFLMKNSKKSKNRGHFELIHQGANWSFCYKEKALKNFTIIVSDFFSRSKKNQNVHDFPSFCNFS